MKRTAIILLASAYLISCGGGDDTKSEKPATTPPATTTTDPGGLSSNPDYQKGLAIEAKNDCATCHRVEEKLTGPPFREIANKYAGVDTAVEYLSKKIIAGGSGVWGQVAMAPHPNLTEEEAKALARYVLLFKK